MDVNRMKNGLLDIWNKVNSFFQKPILQLILFFISFIFVFLLIYIYNILHPLFGDDWMYSVNETGRITSLFEVFHAQYIHYFEWGGRTVVHIIAQVLLLLGDTVHNVLNSLAYMILVLIIYHISVINKWRIHLPLFIGINLLIWFFQSAFASSMLWISGSANYLWGTFIIVCFLCPYLKFFFRNDSYVSTDNLLKIILFFLFGVIAGWTNENTAVALIFILIVLLVYYKYNKGRIPKWTIAGTIGCAVGCLMMLVAPGNQARNEYLKIYENKINAGAYSFESLYEGFFRAIWGFYDYTLILAFIFFFLLIIFRVYGKAENKKKIYFVSALLFLSSLVATLAMAGSPIYPARASFGLNTFLIIGICILFANLDLENNLIKPLSRLTIVFALLLFAKEYYIGYKDLFRAYAITENRIAIIKDGKERGQSNFVFDDATVHSDTRFLHYWELSDDPSASHNKWFSRFYDIDSVRVARK